jgi:cytochrome c oxidase subunit II
MSKRFAFVVFALLAAGCTGPQSVLDPAGDKASSIVWLFWLFTGACAIIWLLVVIFMVAAIARRRDTGDAPTTRPDPAQSRRIGIAVGIAAGITVVTLISFTVLSYFTTRGFAAEPADAINITLTGKQWWWQIEYEGVTPSDTFMTANELHVPVGKAVRVRLTSNDVIHSFWVPNISGKMDLIPGRTNSLTFTVEKPGVYRGQCAEFCGLQHAHMALQVIGESADQFAQWRAHELSEAMTPAEPDRVHGLEVFQRNGCISCHSLRGTPANGTLGPDLTHVAARRTIAAGTLPNTRANLQGWIADPQSVKPGAQMPRLQLSAADLNAVTDYLSGLK